MLCIALTVLSRIVRPSIRLSVCLSYAGIVSKRLNISSNFFTIGYPHHSSFSIPNVMAIFRRGLRGRRMQEGYEKTLSCRRDCAMLRVIEYFAKSLFSCPSEISETPHYTFVKSLHLIIQLFWLPRNFDVMTLKGCFIQKFTISINTSFLCPWSGALCFRLVRPGFCPVPTAIRPQEEPRWS